MAAAIQVTGVKELRRDFRKYETDIGWKPIFKNAYLQGALIVQTSVLAKASSSRMGSRARGTIKGKGTTTMATITAGKGLDYYKGFEFGSGRYRQFPPVQAGGYHLYPAIAENSERITATFFDEMDRGLAGDDL
jgi:hypothetical protein